MIDFKVWNCETLVRVCLINFENQSLSVSTISFSALDNDDMSYLSVVDSSKKPIIRIYKYVETGKSLNK